MWCQMGCDIFWKQKKIYLFFLLYWQIAFTSDRSHFMTVLNCFKSLKCWILKSRPIRKKVIAIDSIDFPAWKQQNDIFDIINFNED